MSVPRYTRAPLLPLRTLGDKLQHLAFLAPADLEAIETIVDDVLTRRLAEAEDQLHALIKWPPSKR